jgi:hypothetical protein
MPSVVNGHLADISQPHHHMRCTRTYFVITSRAAVDLQRAGGGNRPHLILISVRPCLDTTRRRQRRE